VDDDRPRERGGVVGDRRCEVGFHQCSVRTQRGYMRASVLSGDVAERLFRV
jgi:hypothetical protein